MKRYGLIGFPINHSLSPSLFEAAYRDAGMTYDLIEAATAGEALSIFKKDYDAVNVTAPFKEDAFRFADKPDNLSISIGASNILLKEKGIIKAFNSDCLAVMSIIRGLEQKGKLENTDDKIVVVGCGGAGKAAAYASSLCGFTTYVFNRCFAKAELFCSKHDMMEAHPLDSLTSYISTAKLIVYTLPTYLPEVGDHLSPKTIVLEANYRDPSLLEQCSILGTDYISGKEWLIEQALTGFRIMTGKEPDELEIRTSQH